MSRPEIRCLILRTTLKRLQLAIHEAVLPLIVFFGSRHVRVVELVGVFLAILVV